MTGSGLRKLSYDLENTNLENILLLLKDTMDCMLVVTLAILISLYHFEQEKRDVLDIPGCLIPFVTDTPGLVTRVSPMSSNLWAYSMTCCNASVVTFTLMNGVRAENFASCLSTNPAVSKRKSRGWFGFTFRSRTAKKGVRGRIPLFAIPLCSALFG